MATKRNLPSEPERLKQEIARSRERLRVCEDAKRSVSDLIRLSADGNKHVVHTVFLLAQRLVAGLHSIVIARPELGRWLARNTFMWPAFISRKRRLRQANEKLLNTLQLGKGGIFSESEWRLDAPSTWAAIGVFYGGLSRAMAGQCPHLTRKNKEPFLTTKRRRFSFRENVTIA